MAQQTGAIYHQGILYSGGGGTNVTPNPQGEATDTLNTVEIDGTVYGIEGGGGTVLVDSAIDESRCLFTSAVITKFNQTPVTYTATEDCYAICIFKGSTGTNMRPIINGKPISFVALNDMISTILPLKKGDVISNRYEDVSEDCYFNMSIYGRKPGGVISAPVIYSDEERQIGVWRDNKPLYQKTIDCGYLPNNSTISIDHNISNLDMYCHSKIFVFNDVGSSTELCYTAGANDDMGYYLTPTKINIVTKSDRTTWRAYATLQYTKTTDVAGSGEYTTLGVPSVHYSTDEQVIGTWIDGKTLYQKTISIGSMTYGTSWISINHNINNLENVIDIRGKVKSVSDSRMYSIPHYRPTGSRGISIGADTTNVYYMNNWLESSSDATVTLEYTKTTD